MSRLGAWGKAMNIPPMGIWPTREWNPVIGCTPVDDGCRRCYAAERVSLSRDGATSPIVRHDGGISRFSGQLLAAPEAWDAPLKDSPQVVFAFSMSDLFHANIDDARRGRAFATMEACTWSQFNVLTKRADTMMTRCNWPANVRAGVSAHDQQSLDERWPMLRATKAAYRYLSIQPMLGPVTLPSDANGDNLSWVVVMREVGPGGRSMRPEWARDLRDECDARGILFAWEVTDSDSPACRAERRRAAMAGRAYVTQEHRR